MMQKPQSSRRWYVLAPLFAAAFWLAFYGDKTPVSDQVKVVIPRSNESSAQTRIAQVSTQPSSSIGAVKLTKLNELIPRTQLIPATVTGAKGMRDLFSNRDWTPPARSVVMAPAAPVVPTAPPLPFTYLGKKLELGVWEVFLTDGEKTLVVREGSTIENQYRVDAIVLPNISLTYLPMGLSQNLSIGEAQ